MRNPKVGMRVRIKLRKPYTKKEKEDGCDQRINGRAGKIIFIQKKDGLCDVLLDKPMPASKKFTKYDEYFEFPKNLERIK